MWLFCFKILGMKWVIVVSWKYFFWYISAYEFYFSSSTIFCYPNIFCFIYSYKSYLKTHKFINLYGTTLFIPIPVNQFLFCKLFRVASRFCKVLAYSTTVNNRYFCCYHLLFYCIFVLLSTFGILRACHRSPPKTVIVGTFIHKMVTGLSYNIHLL